MTRTALLVGLSLASFAIAQPQEEPDPARSWPHARNDRQDRICDRLEDVKLTATVKDWTLTKVLHVLSSQTRVGIQTDKTVDADAVKISLTLTRRTALKPILDELCKGKPWTWVATDSHVVITREPQRYPRGNARYVRQALDKARLLPPMISSLLDMRTHNKQLRRKIQGVTVTHRALVSPARQVPERLSAITGLKVAIVPGGTLTGGIRLAGGRTRLADLLDAACGQLGAQWTIHRGTVWIGGPTGIAMQNKLAKQSAEVLDDYLAKLSPIDETLVTVGSPGIRLRALVADLARQLGKPIHLDLAAWCEDTKLVLPAKKLPFRDVRALIRDQLGGRVSFVVTDGTAIYGVSKPR